MKTKSTILTKLDGRQKVEFWTKDEFRDRTIKLYSGDFGSMKLDSTIYIPDNTILCDFCNKELEDTDFPVPIVFNNALCHNCYKEMIV